MILISLHLCGLAGGIFPQRRKAAEEGKVRIEYGIYCKQRD